MNMKFRFIGKFPHNLKNIFELKLAGILITPLERTIRLIGNLTFSTLNLTVIFLQFPMDGFSRRPGPSFPDLKYHFLLTFWF